MTSEKSVNASATILVVDDEQPIREMVRRILEEAGYVVTEATNGLEAIEMLKEGVPLDLLMADLDMPKLGGDEMAVRIRGMRPDQRVLYVTGHIDRLMDERPLLWDGEAFLEKPFSAAGLLEAVSMILYGTLQKRD
jgi:CheY-like chemotaxis protein